jgi:hypothetical protein
VEGNCTLLSELQIFTGNQVSCKQLYEGRRGKVAFIEARYRLRIFHASGNMNIVVLKKERATGSEFIFFSLISMMVMG